MHPNFSFFKNFNWRLITLKYCSVFVIHSHESAMYVHVFPILNPRPHLPHPIPLGHPSAPALSTLSHASKLDWRSVSPMVIYMFQSYSLKSSHPCLLPQSPNDCSIRLYLFCCFAYTVIVTIFLNSIYVHSIYILVFFFLAFFTLYNRLQFPSTSLEMIQMYSF